MDPAPSEDVEKYGELALDACWEVYRHFGPGMYERVYQDGLEFALQDAGVPYEREVWIDITFRGRRIERAYKIDFVVGDCVGLEAKALDFLNPVFERQLVSYITLGNWPLGFLVNFNSTWFRQGIKRKVNSKATRRER